MRNALLLIDLQNDYFPGGAWELTGSLEAVANAAQLLAAFRAAGKPVIHIQHLASQPGAPFFVPGTVGVAIHASVAPAQGEPVIIKHFANSFRETALLATLRTLGVDSLLIAGMMTHNCVDATTRAAFDLGLHCRIAGDACATRALSYQGETVPAAQVQTAFLSALSFFHAEVAPTASWLAAGV